MYKTKVIGLHKMPLLYDPHSKPVVFREADPDDHSYVVDGSYDLISYRCCSLPPLPFLRLINRAI